MAHGAILIDENSEILAAHARQKAALRLRLDQLQADRNRSADDVNGDLDGEG
jgi:hypothetical protein